MVVVAGLAFLECVQVLSGKVGSLVKLAWFLHQLLNPLVASGNTVCS